jgi:hypothetical protein
MNFQSCVSGLNAALRRCDVISVQIFVCNMLSAQMSSSPPDGLEDLVVPALIQCAQASCTEMYSSILNCCLHGRVSGLLSPEATAVKRERLQEPELAATQEEI